MSIIISWVVETVRTRNVARTNGSVIIFNESLFNFIITCNKISIPSHNLCENYITCVSGTL